MNTKILTILSNYSYLLASIYLIDRKYFTYGIFAFIMWYISHNYHNNVLNKFWMNIVFVPNKLKNLFRYIFRPISSRIFSNVYIELFIFFIVIVHYES